MKGQKFIFITIIIYIAAGITTLYYLPSYSSDTAIIVENTSVSDISVTPSSDADTVSENMISKNEETENTETTNENEESVEIPLFTDIKGTSVYMSRSYQYTASHTEGNLFLRAEPDKNSKIVGRLSPGDTGIVTTLNTEWSYVTYQNKQGYISNQYLAFTEITPEPEDSVQDSSSFIVLSDVNIREGATGNSEILGVLKTGESGTVLLYDENWTYIKSGSITGYVNTPFIHIQ